MSIMLNTREQCRIKRAIISAIRESFQNMSLSEPQLIANLTYWLPKILNSIFIKNVKFEVGGIFIHQKPYVKNISNPLDWTRDYVELGDLLLINNLEKGGKVLQRTALLLQAKKNSINPARNIEPDNKDQWDLYTRWPRFEYVRASKQGLNGVERYIDCLAEPDIFDGAKYLIIDDFHGRLPYLNREWPYFNRKWPYYNLSDYVANSTQPKLSKFKPFYCEIFDFITGNAGKKFDIGNLQQNVHGIGWNRVIDDLIKKIVNVTLSKSIKKIYPNQEEEKQVRGQGILYCNNSFSSSLSVFYNKLHLPDGGGDREPPRGDFPDDMDWEGGGISVIEINTVVGTGD